MLAGPVAAVQTRRVGAARDKVVAIRRRPAGLTRHAPLVSNPTDVRTSIAKEYAVGLEVAHELPRRRPVVIRAIVEFPSLVRAAIVTVAAVRAVEEDLENRTVAREQLAQLIAVVDEILRPPVILVVTIPRRQIDAEFETRSRAGFGDFFDDVPPPAAPGTVLDRVLGVLRRPEAEAIVVLAGENQALHPAVFRSRDDLVGIEVRGIENRRRFIAIAPLAVRECVHGEMEEAVELHFVPAELSRRREGAVWRGRINQQLRRQG